MFCARCGFALSSDQAFCPKCGQRIGVVVPGHLAQAPAQAVVVVQSAQPLHSHSSLMALLSGLLIPGAGQAYNGQPVKGFFFLFFSVLLVPYLWSVLDAYFQARRIVKEGGRYGRGGLGWVFLQGWLMLNVAVLAVIGLSVAGVLP